MRLYVDESGTAGSMNPNNPMSRYFGLVGVAIPQDERHATFVELFTSLKRNFLPLPAWADRDEVCVLHREDIVNRTAPHFECLRDEQVRKRFDEALLKAIEAAPFVLYGVVLDKQTHQAATHRAMTDGYHYSMLAMLERYCGRMARRQQLGDVLAESRGGAEDKALKRAFREISTGSNPHRRYFPAEHRDRLTSKEIKLRGKRDSVLGLELADLLARDVTREILAERGLVTAPTGYGAELLAVVAKKYNRRFGDGRISGYGRVWLP